MVVKKPVFITIGDIMLDQYIFGRATKLSPEAPVPVINIYEEKNRLGGAANVSANIKGLGNTSILCGIMGADESGGHIFDMLKKLDLDPSFIYMCPDHKTTKKTRIMAGQQHLLRMDKEIIKKIEGAVEEQVIDYLKGAFFKNQPITGVLVSDYNKGTITQNIMNFLRKQSVPIFVDPKPENFHFYRDVTCLTPNRQEAEEITGIKINSGKALIQAGKVILNNTRAKVLFITLGDQGMAVFTKDDCFLEPTVPKKVFDVTGAGDTVLAIIAHAYTHQFSLNDIARLANKGGAYAVEQLGTAIIQRERIFS